MPDELEAIRNAQGNFYVNQSIDTYIQANRSE